MKKLLFLFIGVLLISCSDDKKDPEPKPEPDPVMVYEDPLLVLDLNKVKSYLHGISNKVTKEEENNSILLDCDLTSNQTSIFDNLSYRFEYDGFNVKKLTLNYKLKDIVPETDQMKFQNYLKTVKIN